MNGVIGATPIHKLSQAAKTNVVKVDAMRIDIGAKNSDEAARKVKPGQTAAFVTGYEELGECAIGKAFDDRAGCAVLVELLRRAPYPFDLVAAFTASLSKGS